MRRTFQRVSIATLLVALASLSGTGTALAANDKLTRSQMNTIVSSSAVAPTGLGPTSKNVFVYTTSATRTPVCLRANGTFVQLPAGRPAGTLGYTLQTPNTVVGTMLVQYPTKKAANAAAKKLVSPRCPQAASTTTDGGRPLVPVDQGGDNLAPIAGNLGYLALTINEQFSTVQATRVVGTVVVSVSGTAAPDQLQALDDWAKAAVDAAAQQVIAALR